MSRLRSVAIAASAVAGALSLGVGAIAAATPAATRTDRMNSIVNAIAQKFNLNPTDVQQVFDAEHQKMQAQRQADLKTRLDQAVKDGKITQAQEDLIVAKHQEMKTFMDSMKDKTPAERETAMKSQRDALKKWATDNNIPPQFLMPFGDHGRGRGFGPMDGGKGKGMHRK